MSKNVFIFDSSPLVYIYLNKPRGYEPHPLLLKYKRELGMEFLLAKNDLDKDLVNPLQTKYGNQIGILFSLKMSPRDELFEDLKENALKNHYITKEDVYNHKLTDIDIVRLAIKYQQEDKEVTIISDDEGVHNLVSDIEVEYELKIIYTHLFFLELLPLLTDKNDKEIIKENIQESYYYLKNYLKKDERYLPYEKVMSESIFLLSQVTLASESDEETQLQKDIEQYIKQGTTSKKITKFIPLLKVMRNKRIDSNYPTEEACLDLLSELRTYLKEEEDIYFSLIDLVHREFASYHLELAKNDHTNLNLVGALAHIRAASRSLAFLKTHEEPFKKSIDELLFIEALLLLELGSEKEALMHLEYLEKNSSDLEFNIQSLIEALLIIYDKKIGLIGEKVVEPLLELVKEAIQIPNPQLAKKILQTIMDDSKLQSHAKKLAAEEIIHLYHLQLLLKKNPLVLKAKEILGESIEDRTDNPPDAYNLEKVKEDLECDLAKPYRGPWEIAEIRTRKKSTRIYAWNENLKSLWVLQFPGNPPKNLEKARAITLLKGTIQNYKKHTNLEDIKYRTRVVFEEPPLYVIDEKRAFPLW